MTSAERYLARNKKPELPWVVCTRLAVATLGLLIAVTAYMLLDGEGHLVDDPVPAKMEATAPD